MNPIDKTQKRKANVYMLCFALFAAAVLLFVYFFGQNSVKRDNVQCENAVFDCTAARDLHEAHRYYLEGDWQFFYRQWIKSDGMSAAEPSDFLRVPGSWAGNLFHHTPYENGGYASYRCFVQGLKTDSALTVYVPNLACAYRVYADGELITESGILSKTPGATDSNAAALREKVYLDEGMHEIIIEVSGDVFSGLYLPPILAEYTYENSYVSGMLALRYTLIGAIFYAAIVLFVFSGVVKVRFFSPWLPILFVLIAFRMMFSTEGYSITQTWLYTLDYEKMHLLTFANPFIIKLCALLYFRDELKLDIPLRSVIGISGFFAAIILTAYAFPQAVFNNSYFWILQLLSSVADIYILRKLCNELAAGKKNSGIICGAYLFLLCGVNVNILYMGGVMSTRTSSFMPISFTLFALFITVIHARNAILLYQRVQRTRQLERELEQANMAVMISQIQPHFLYNALNTIKSLIRRNPKAAEEAVIDFSYYLRGNMDSLSHAEPIPFRTELEHIHHYCKIELLRFPDKLHLEYDIETDAFNVPPLSIQPLVENAIKHGVTKRPEGGTVNIHAYEDAENYIVSVEDDGVGFDPTVVLKKDGRSHVGLPNTCYRLESMLHAKVDIKSKIGIGTTVTVRIPK